MSKEEYKIEVPIMTNDEEKQFERLMETEFESLFDRVSKHIYKERECIYLQKMIEKLKNDLDKEKEKNKKLMSKIDVTNWQEKMSHEILDEKYISIDKIKEIIKDLDEYDINFYDNIQMLKDVTKKYFRTFIRR